MRLATTLGTSPCSAIATSAASRICRCASVGSRPVDQQPNVIGKGDPTNQLTAQVHSANDDHFGVARRNRRAGLLLPPDLQKRTTPEGAVFRIANYLSRIEHTGPVRTRMSIARQSRPFRYFGYRNKLGGICRLQEKEACRPHAAKPWADSPRAWRSFARSRASIRH